MTRPLSLLVVSTSLNTGGAQRFTSTLLTHLDREVVRPSLALLRDDIGFKLPTDVPIHQLEYRRGWHLFDAAGRLRRLIEKSRPEMILSNITATNLVTGLALRSCVHQPQWIARVGNNPGFHDTFVRASLARLLYRRVDRFVVNSPGLADDLARQYAIDTARATCLLNPTDFEAMDFQANSPTAHAVLAERPLLLAVGRLFKQKRYDVMIDAFARVRSRIQAHLWICGEGPERNRLERQIQRHGLNDHVKLLGFCDNPYALMNKADLFLMSSDHEGLPNALIEAQGMGLPAVSTDCPHGPREIIVDQRTGLLVPTANPKAMAEAISTLLEAPPRLSEMSVAARETARRRFGAAALTGQWQQCLVSLVDNAAGQLGLVTESEPRCVG